MMGQKWWTKTILIGSVVAALLLPIGALGSRIGLWPFTIGFLFLGAGAIAAAAAALLGLVGVIFAAVRSWQREIAPLAIGSILGVVTLGVLFVQYSAAQSVPPIHNITTNFDDPPQFDAVVPLRGEGANPHVYDAEQPVGTRTLAAAQRQAWPELGTQRFELGLEEASERALLVVEGMGLALVHAKLDAVAGEAVIEATDTTFWFGFKDDMVVRLRTDGAETMVDVRSVSRVGQSDLGLNARRIVTFLHRFERA